MSRSFGEIRDSALVIERSGYEHVYYRIENGSEFDVVTDRFKWTYGDNFRVTRQENIVSFPMFVEVCYDEDCIEDEEMPDLDILSKEDVADILHALEKMVAFFKCGKGGE